MTVHAACTHVCHDKIDCRAAGFPHGEWCESCQANIPTTIPIRRVGGAAVPVDLHRFEDDGGPVAAEMEYS